MRIFTLLAALMLILSGCASQPDGNMKQTDAETPVSVSGTIPEETAPEIEDVGEDFDDASFNILGNDDDTQYAYRYENDECVMYSMALDGSGKKPIAVFQSNIPGFVGGPHMDRNHIIDFGICGDWIILCVGQYGGSANIFYGDFARLKKDGSALAHFWLTDDNRFVIVDDWIYYFYWVQEGTSRYDPDKREGCYRIRPDGSDEEYLGDKIRRVFFYAEDGYLYGEFATDEWVWQNPITNLIRCRPDGSETITLFTGSSLPKLGDADYIVYRNVEANDLYISFTVIVHGYTTGDSWRGHDMYTADYRVDKDGSNLILLNEKYFNR